MKKAVLVVVMLFAAQGSMAQGWPFGDWAYFTLEGQPSLRGISVVNDTICWVSGSQGTVARSTDGGNTWQRVSVPDAEGLDFRDIEAFSAQEAVLMSAGPGEQSKLYRTTDGGAHWELTHSNMEPEGFFNAISFWNEQEGILTGDPLDGRAYFLVTADGGRHWEGIADAPQMMEGEYGFAASGSHLAVGNGGRVWLGTGGSSSRVLYSTDGGSSWSAAETDIVQGEPSQGIFSLAINDSGFGIAVGGDYTQEEAGQDHVLVTQDFGLHWRLVSPTGVTFLSAVVLAGGEAFFATGPKGIFYSPDAGLAWQRYDGLGFHTLEAAPSGRVLWGSGPSGRVGRLVIE